MPAYHSAFVDVGVQEALCSCPVLPLKTRVRGPAPCVEPSATEDVVDEALRLFRANVLFRNFELLSGGDRLLVYLTLFIHLVRGVPVRCSRVWRPPRPRPPSSSPLAQCLKRASTKLTKAEGARELSTLASSNHVIPGDAGWPLASIIPAPKNSVEQGEGWWGWGVCQSVFERSIHHGGSDAFRIHHGGTPASLYCLV